MDAGLAVVVEATGALTVVAVDGATVVVLAGFADVVVVCGAFGALVVVARWNLVREAAAGVVPAPTTATEPSAIAMTKSAATLRGRNARANELGENWDWS